MISTPRRQTLLLIASFPESLVAFRGAFIQAALDSGLSVEVAMPDAKHVEGLAQYLAQRGVRAHCLPLRRTGVNPLIDVLLVIRMYRLMRKLRPDMIMGYTIKPVVYGSIAAWMARVPRRVALITGLGYAFTDRHTGLARLIRWLYTLALRRVHLVFFQNPDDKALFRELGIVRSDQRVVVVNGSGVDVDAFARAPMLVGRGSSFLLIARLLGDKGIREYVMAAQRIRAERPDVSFRLAGWIDENPDSIPEAELRLWMERGDVEFLGRLGDVRPALAECSVYVLPSYREGTPRTVLEAMATGRAVITTDAPGCRETVVDGVNGFLVPVRSVDSLVEAMRKFIEMPGLAERMGGRSREIAVTKYDARKVNAAMLREIMTANRPDGEIQE